MLVYWGFKCGSEQQRRHPLERPRPVIAVAVDECWAASRAPSRSNATNDVDGEAKNAWEKQILPCVL